MQYRRFNHQIKNDRSFHPKANLATRAVDLIYVKLFHVLQTLREAELHRLKHRHTAIFCLGLTKSDPIPSNLHLTGDSTANQPCPFHTNIGLCPEIGVSDSKFVQKNIFGKENINTFGIQHSTFFE